MQGKRKIVAALLFLGSLHLAILLAGFIAPADPAAQNRDFPFAPPARIHFVDAEGNFHLRPFVYELASSPDSLYQYQELRGRQYPVHLFVRGPEYKLAGVLTCHLHLFGVDTPAQIFLAGTDNYGRDQFSRVLYGGQMSVAAGLLATGISLFLGLVVGCV